MPTLLKRLASPTLRGRGIPGDFVLALVEFFDHERRDVRYLRRPFERSGITTDFNGASVNFQFADLLARAAAPG